MVTATTTTSEPTNQIRDTKFYTSNRPDEHRPLADCFIPTNELQRTPVGSSSAGDQPSTSTISLPSAGLPEQGDHDADSRVVELPVVINL